MAKKISQAWWTRAFVVVAAGIFLFSGWAWWHYVRSNPERTFFAAVENSLRTQGVTRIVNQESGSQKMEQKVRLGVGSQNLAHGLTAITQEGAVDATIKTEAISTDKEEYIRYTAIDTDQKGASGQTLDFSSLLNIWGKTTSQASCQGGELFGESILGVIPVGNLTADRRAPIVNLIHEKQVYQIEKVDHTNEAGRPVYKYTVKVMPEAYVTMLKEFGKAVNLCQLEGLNPADYKDSDPITFSVKVDVWSRQMTGIDYSGGSRSEKFTSYGVSPNVEIPKDSIPVEELQTKLQAISQ
jgi:hypothetical protein